MKKLTKSQQCILDKMATLKESDLILDMPFNIARKPTNLSFFGRILDI